MTAMQDIFSINQKQLESAVRRITGDPALEPARKDYLVQHIMASRYVVAQQMRLESAVVQPIADPIKTFAAPCVAVWQNPWAERTLGVMAVSNIKPSQTHSMQTGAALYG